MKDFKEVTYQNSPKLESFESFGDLRSAIQKREYFRIELHKLTSESDLFTEYLSTYLTSKNANLHSHLPVGNILDGFWAKGAVIVRFVDRIDLVVAIASVISPPNSPRKERYTKVEEDALLLNSRDSAKYLIKSLRAFRYQDYPHITSQLMYKLCVWAKNGFWQKSKEEHLSHELVAYLRRRNEKTGCSSTDKQIVLNQIISNLKKPDKLAF